jgi:branched-subunit amino acid transport protein
MQESLFFILIGMTAVTYLPRVFPLWLLTKREIPAALRIWLQYIPVAVLAALLTPSLIIQKEQVDFSLSNTTLLAAVPTFLVAYVFKNTLFTIVVGMTCLGLIRWLLPAA